MMRDSLRGATSVALALVLLFGLMTAADAQTSERAVQGFL